MKITLETRRSKSGRIYVAAFAQFRYSKQAICFGSTALELFDYTEPIEQGDFAENMVLDTKFLEERV